MSINTRPTQTEDVHFRVIAPRPTPVPTLHRPALDIVVPVHNQEQELARAVHSTREVATALSAELAGVRLIHLNQEAHGRALAAAWMTSDARVVASAGLDIDVSNVPQLIAPVISGHSEISIAGRSKALRADVARKLIPTVLSRSRLFETELLLRARRAGMRIHAA